MIYQNKSIPRFIKSFSVPLHLLQFVCNPIKTSGKKTKQNFFFSVQRRIVYFLDSSFSPILMPVKSFYLQNAVCDQSCYCSQYHVCLVVRSFEVIQFNFNNIEFCVEQVQIFSDNPINLSSAFILFLSLQEIFYYKIHLYYLSNILYCRINLCNFFVRFIILGSYSNEGRVTLLQRSIPYLQISDTGNTNRLYCNGQFLKILVSFWCALNYRFHKVKTQSEIF